MKITHKKIIFALFVFCSIPLFVFAKESIVLSSEDIISSTKPSVVKIVYSAKGTLDIPNFIFDYRTGTIEDPQDKNDIIPIPIDNTLYGTGFVISEDGVIVTNSHIVEGVLDNMYRTLAEVYLEDTTEQEIAYAMTKYTSEEEAYDAAYDVIYKYLREKSVKNLEQDIRILKPHDDAQDFSDLIENGYKAQVLSSNVSFDDDKKDIAILKIDATNLPTIPFSTLPESSITTGQKVYAFGFPSSAFFGGSDFLEPTFSQGFINAIKKQNDITIYQTDTKVSEGSSGSPLLDAQGNVIGIISFISGADTGGDNFGFAIPTSVILEKIQAAGIQVRPNAYFEKYMAGLEYLQDNRCKKAIEQFQSALGVNADFGVEKFVQSKIETCNNLIASGKSNDSIFSGLVSMVKGNYLLGGILIFILVLVGGVLAFFGKLTKRIKRDEKIIKEIEVVLEKDKSVTIDGFSTPAPEELVQKEVPSSKITLTMPNPSVIPPNPAVPTDPYIAENK